MPARQQLASILGTAALLAVSAFAVIAAPPPAVTAPSPATHTGMPRNTAMPPRAAPVMVAQLTSKWTFPAPLAGNPPEEMWLPHALSDEDKKYRLAADRMLMASNYINGNELMNAGSLQDELRDGRYDDMESQLDAVLAKFLADPAYEFALHAMAGFADQGHAQGFVSPTANLDAWVKARPDSVWAHYSRGLRWYNDAWEARGNGWANDVSDAQWKVMQDDEAKGRAELEAAIKIEPRLAPAWVTLLLIDRDGSGLDKVTADFDRASKAVPTSDNIPSIYEDTLEPRWLGSSAMMDDFAESELANLDKNPRFWDLQGNASADRGGCASCDHHAWEVSLKEYNAALAYADRPSWLENAGKAALHVHRYALAYAYYQRALAMEHTLPYDNMFSGFAVERCDPAVKPEDLEKYRHDMVLYAGLEDEPYPLGPDACVVYQRELPWEDQTLPDITVAQVLAIDPLGHPVYAMEPAAINMPYKDKSLASPDGKWLLTESQADDKTFHVTLHDQKTGWQMEIFSSSDASVMAGFNTTGKRLFVSDMTQGQKGGCRYYDPFKMQPIDIKPKVLQWIADQHLALNMDTVKVYCMQFINDDVLSAALFATGPDGKQVFHMFSFDPVAERAVLTH